MTCRKCQATIADKAIVCYRCGTPTAEPVAPVVPSRRSASGLVPALLILALVAFVAWWVLPGPATDRSRLIALAVGVFFTMLALLRLRQSRARP